MEYTKIDYNWKKLTDVVDDIKQLISKMNNPRIIASFLSHTIVYDSFERFYNDNRIGFNVYTINSVIAVNNCIIIEF